MHDRSKGNGHGARANGRGTEQGYRLNGDGPWGQAHRVNAVPLVQRLEWTEEQMAEIGPGMAGRLLWLLAFRSNDACQCWWGNEKLAVTFGCSTRTISTALAHLIDLGLIHEDFRPTKKGRFRIIHIHAKGGVEADFQGGVEAHFPYKQNMGNRTIEPTKGVWKQTSTPSQNGGKESRDRLSIADLMDKIGSGEFDRAKHAKR